MKRNQLRGIVAAVSGTLLFGFAHMAMADSSDDLLKKLHDKGVLSDEEYDQFNAQRDSEKVKKSSEIKASFKDGISWQSSDGATKMSVSGRIQTDYRSFSDVPTQSSNSNTADTWDIRRAYLGAKGTFYNSINWELTTDLAAKTDANSSNNANNNNGYIKYGWLEAAWWEQAKLRFGQFKSPFGLEQNTSSRFIDFTERDWGASLAPGVDRGMMLHGVPVKGMYYAVSAMNGAYLADYGQNNIEPNNNYQGKEYDGRLAVNFAQLSNIQDMILHAGVDYGKATNLPSINGATNQGGTSGPNTLSFRTNGRGTQFFTTTGTYLNPDIQREGLEGIVAYKQFKFQTEGYQFKLEPGSGLPGPSAGSQDKKIKTWYADVAWLITGENYSDAYKDGLMDRIRPKNDFIAPGAPGIGAWEVAARYSKFDAKDFSSCNGNAAACGSTNGLASTAVDYNYANSSNDVHSWSAGLKWIPNPNTRFMLDYIDTKFDHAITGNNSQNNGTTVAPYDTEKAINLRAQIDF